MRQVHTDCCGNSSATPYRRARLSRSAGRPDTRKVRWLRCAALVQPSNMLTAAESTDSTLEKSTRKSSLAKYCEPDSNKAGTVSMVSWPSTTSHPSSRLITLTAPCETQHLQR